jgi:hypothetical protein
MSLAFSSRRQRARNAVIAISARPFAPMRHRCLTVTCLSRVTGEAGHRGERVAAVHVGTDVVVGDGIKPLVDECTEEDVLAGRHLRTAPRARLRECADLVNAIDGSTIREILGNLHDMQIPFADDIVRRGIL